MDIRFIILYVISFVTLVFCCWKLGTLEAQLDIIMQILRGEDNNYDE